MARTVREAVRLTVAMCVLCALSFAGEPPSVDAQLHLDRGFRQMYNLDFAAAHDTFHQYQ